MPTLLQKQDRDLARLTKRYRRLLQTQQRERNKIVALVKKLFREQMLELFKEHDRAQLRVVQGPTRKNDVTG